jgi:hypothetical protein
MGFVVQTNGPADDNVMARELQPGRRVSREADRRPPRHRLRISGKPSRKPGAKCRAAGHEADPTGNSPREFRDSPSSPSDKNILIFRNGKSGYKRTRPAPPEGRSRSSRTWERDAVDADAPLTNGVFRGRQKRVVLTPHGWRQVGGGAQGPTGRRAPYSPATVTNKS